MKNEIWIYDEIGPDYWGLVSAKKVIDELSQFGKSDEVTVRINSPGGSVVEAQAIYNALRRHEGDVTIEIDALAASAASFIAMAGDKIRMAENAMLMIHFAWSVAIGNAEEFRKQADILDKFDGIISDTYSTRSGVKKEKMDEMLAAETWLTAAEAVDLKLADEIGTPLNVAAASIKEGRYNKTPARFLANELPREQQARRAIAAARNERFSAIDQRESQFIRIGIGTRK